MAEESLGALVAAPFSSPTCSSSNSSTSSLSTVGGFCSFNLVTSLIDAALYRNDLLLHNCRVDVSVTGKS
jgi:hypothetical protein